MNNSQDTQAIEFLNDNSDVIVIKDETHPLAMVKGDKNFLVDSGITVKARKYHDAIATALENRKLDTLLLTHSHFDHVGSASFLQKSYGFNVLGSKDSVEILANPDMIEMINFQNQQLESMYDGSPGITCQPLHNLSQVNPGDHIPVAPGRWFEVIASPGHSRCSVSYLLQPDKILFPGDAAGMIEKNGEMQPVFFHSYRDYERTLLELAAIAPAAIFFPHSAPLTSNKDVTGYFEKSVAAARQMKDEILADLRRSPDVMKVTLAHAEKKYSTESIMGSRDSFIMHTRTLVNTIKNEFLTTGYR